MTHKDEEKDTNQVKEDIVSFFYDESKMIADINKISMFRDKNERLSFKRKKDKMEELVKQVNEIQDKVLKIMLDEIYPLTDQISILRAEMVRECIHPKDQLLHMGTHVICKFCDAKLSLPKINA